VSFEKMKTTRDEYNNKYNISINNDDISETVTLRNKKPSIIKYSNQLNSIYSDDKNSNNKNLNVSFNSYSNFNKIYDNEKLWNSLDHKDGGHFPAYMTQLNWISSIIDTDNKDI